MRISMNSVRFTASGSRKRSIQSVLPHAALSLMFVAGCKDVSATLPSGTPNPAIYNSRQGALMKRNAVDSMFESGLLNYIIATGLISDELGDPNTGSSQQVFESSTRGNLDERILPDVASPSADPQRGYVSYQYLQATRGTASEAIGSLAKYDTVDSPAVRGEMYALQGYAEIMMAELFCSGVPLSTYDFGGDFTYKPGSTQQDVYHDAIAKLDSAIALSSDSAGILNLARVGLGRAYLDMGDYASAATAVATVPDGFRYQLQLQWQTGLGNALNVSANLSSNEGTNGLPFASDPRTQRIAAGTSPLGSTLYFPRKYSTGLDSAVKYYSPVTVADGIEARLIQAEAALNASDPSWLTILNAIRATGPASADTIADTLGVTGCNGAVVCGNPPGGYTPAFGQPPGGFVPPTGYVYVATDTTRNAQNIRAHDGETIPDYCDSYSWYYPCSVNNLLVMQLYVKTSPGMPALTDPGASLSGQAATDARVDLLFQERAYWMYITGHRQGDLRRLVRQYHRDQSTVYPTGLYLAPGQGIYGSDVNEPIPSSETPNPYFHGCLDRNA